MQRELELLSVVAPVLDEEEVVEELHRRTCAALAGVPFELVVVDDGSTDRSAERLRALAAIDERLRVIELSRRFGHQAAITAGLEHARGDVVVTMDGDLQDPPEEIPRLLERWRDGADVVLAVRRRREGESRFKLRTASWFYRLFSAVTEVDLPRESGDFRLMDRRALDAVLAMRERSRFLRGMAVWVGFTQTTVEYDREARAKGETKFSLGRMMRFSMDALTSFSHAPLQLATLFGFACSLLAFVGIPLTIVARVFDVYVPGISSTIVIILLLGGIQLITVGVIGEYVARIYDEVKQRPLYVVRATTDDPPDRSAPERLPDAERLLRS